MESYTVCFRPCLHRRTKLSRGRFFFFFSFFLSFSSFFSFASHQANFDVLDFELSAEDVAAVESFERGWRACVPTVEVCVCVCVCLSVCVCVCVHTRVSVYLCCTCDSVFGCWQSDGHWKRVCTHATECSPLSLFFWALHSAMARLWHVTGTIPSTHSTTSSDLVLFPMHTRTHTHTHSLSLSLSLDLSLSLSLSTSLCLSVSLTASFGHFSVSRLNSVFWLLLFGESANNNHHVTPLNFTIHALNTLVDFLIVK